MIARFSVGRVVGTPGALDTLERHKLLPGRFLSRHIQGDWGDLDAHDKRANDHALKTSARVMSSYNLPDGDFLWIVTEPVANETHPEQRDITTFLLPDEY